MQGDSSDPPGEGRAIAAGDASVAVGGDNFGTINTGIVFNIHAADDAERSREIARAILAATRLAPPLDAQRRQEVTAYYLAIAQTLDDAVQALRAGVVPHGKCGEMRGYAQQLAHELGDVISPQQAAGLSHELMQSYDVERFGAAFMHLPDAERDEKFAVLDEAAGYFRAAARSVQARR
jgi:hypothetical protein